MHLYYTARSSGFDANVNYRNPRYFVKPEYGVTEVTVEGNFPDVVAAYGKVGIKVTQVDGKPKVESAKQKSTKTTKAEVKPKE